MTYYPEGGDDEFYQMFVGPTPAAIHDFRRQCVVEDVSSLLARHLGKAETEQVAALINQLFDAAGATVPKAGQREHQLFDGDSAAPAEQAPALMRRDDVMKKACNRRPFFLSDALPPRTPWLHVLLLRDLLLLLFSISPR